jgi:hypothetical protein
MEGYELLHARQRLRSILRRTASLEGFSTGAFLALDEQELVKRADLADQSAQGDAVKRHLILLGLSQMNLSLAAIAAAWHLDVATIAAWTSVPVVDRSGRAGEIEQQVLDELPRPPAPPRRVARAL